MTMYAAVSGPTLLGFLETKVEAARRGTPVLLPAPFERFTRAGRVVTWDGSSFGYDLTAVKNDLGDAINAERARRMARATVAGVGVMQADPTSLTYLNARRVTVGNGPQGADTPVSIRLADDSTVTVTPAVFEAAVLAVNAHVSAVLDASWSIKATVDASSDVAALLKFDVTQGWPA